MHLATPEQLVRSAPAARPAPSALRAAKGLSPLRLDRALQVLRAPLASRRCVPCVFVAVAATLLLAMRERRGRIVARIDIIFLVRAVEH